MGFTPRRVVGAPVVTGSNGRYRIVFDGGVVEEPAATSAAKPAKATHADATSFGVVYANDLARPALAGATRAKFPAGSIIVREKLAREGDAAPQLLAIMIKRAPGFNPKGGDWEFLTADGSATKIRERQKSGSCLDCHASRREQDFVFPLAGAK